MFTANTARGHSNRGTSTHAPVPVATCILIVDDDRRSSLSLTFMLAARGFEEVRAVRSGARALAVAGKFQPGIIFLDLELPDRSSLDLAERLRRSANQSSLRLIALTSSVEHGSREDARSAGFERYMVKPLEQIELDKILRLPVS